MGKSTVKKQKTSQNSKSTSTKKRTSKILTRSKLREYNNAAPMQAKNDEKSGIDCEKSTVNDDSNDFDVEEDVNCPICMEIFHNKQDLEDHLIKWHPDNDENNENVEGGRVECHICKKTYSCATTLRRHLVTHTNARPYSCDICGKDFAWSSACNAHRNNVHFGNYRFKCETCGRGFKTKEVLKRHETSHTGLKPFECDICGKKFSRNTLLKQHIHLHTGLRPFSCDLCHRSFNTKGNLNSHKKLAHTGTLRFFCDICGKGFKVKTGLIPHFIMHRGDKPYECKLCGKKYADPKALKKHVANHDNLGKKKWHSCDLCSKVFKQKVNLDIHRCPGK